VLLELSDHSRNEAESIRHSLLHPSFHPTHATI
jgi:hypothetical protein